MKPTTLALAAMSVSLLALGAPAAAHAETACADLVKTALPHAEITSAKAATVAGKDVCQIAVTSRPTKVSDIRMEVWIPVGAAWNGKFVQVGNGGFAGAVPKGSFLGPIKAGYAVSGTDDGHQEAVGTSAAWALGHSEKVIDFGYRALKETTEISKALVAAQKGSKATRSYFAGCSDGGREALMEAQRYPTDFDGIVVIPHMVEAEALRLAAEKVSKESASRVELLAGKKLREVYDSYGVL